MPMALVAVVAFVIGVTFMGIYRITDSFRLRKEIKTLIKDIKEKDEELSSFRNLPLTSEDITEDQTQTHEAKSI